MVGGTANPTMPAALTHQPGVTTVTYTGKNADGRKPRGRRDVKSVREWVLSKKERRRRQGREVRPDTRFTGRKRPDKF